MSIIMWDKPRKKMSKDAWKEDYGFEDGPTGGYQPNMSVDDAARWKGKITGTKLGYPQVEIRKSAGPSLMTIIVNLGDGYNYKQYKALPDDDRAQGYRDQIGGPKSWLASHADADYFHLTDGGTAGINTHISMNGPSTFTFTEMAEFALVIEEAKATLEALIGPGERQSYVAYTKGDAAKLSDEIKAIEGVRIRSTLAAIKAVNFTCTQTALDAIKALPGITKVIGHEEAVVLERRGYDVRHGYPADEDD